MLREEFERGCILKIEVEEFQAICGSTLIDVRRILVLPESSAIAPSGYCITHRQTIMAISIDSNVLEIVSKVARVHVRRKRLPEFEPIH